MDPENASVVKDILDRLDDHEEMLRDVRVTLTRRAEANPATAQGLLDLDTRLSAMETKLNHLDQLVRESIGGPFEGGASDTTRLWTVRMQLPDEMSATGTEG